MFAAEPLPGAAGDAVSQALAVLTGLGYTPGEAREAVRHAAAGNGGGRSVEELVTVALRGLDRRD
jgi:Holliday junction resolvasome RuvABC DNA-binding subunit